MVWTKHRYCNLHWAGCMVIRKNLAGAWEIYDKNASNAEPIAYAESLAGAKATAQKYVDTNYPLLRIRRQGTGEQFTGRDDSPENKEREG